MFLYHYGLIKTISNARLLTYTLFSDCKRAKTNHYTTAFHTLPVHCTDQQKEAVYTSIQAQMVQVAGVTNMLCMLCLGGVIFLSISGILGVYAISATFCSLFSSVSK